MSGWPSAVRGSAVAANGWGLGLARGRRRQREDPRQDRRNEQTDELCCHRSILFADPAFVPPTLGARCKIALHLILQTSSQF